jgi:cysteine desulfurase
VKSIYFDNNATTPVDPLVCEAMLPYLKERFGNPSSPHRFGQSANEGITMARDNVSALIGCHPERLIFTSSGTESNNTAIWCAVRANPDKKHIISSQVEHHSVVRLLEFLQKHGYDIQLLSVDQQGKLDLEELGRSIGERTALVSLMGANNETGVIWPIKEIGEIVKSKGVLFQSDAVQMLGKVPLDMKEIPVDYLSISSHKIHGPKGAGAIYVRRGVPFSPLIFGGRQEKDRRAGTENVPAIVGFGKAAELALSHLQRGVDARLKTMRDYLENQIRTRIPEVKINGAGQPRLPNTLNASFRHASSEAMVQELDEKCIAISARATCETGTVEPSHVLRAMGIEEDYIYGSLRISLSRFNTIEEIEVFLDILPLIVQKSCQLFPM